MRGNERNFHLIFIACWIPLGHYDLISVGVINTAHRFSPDGSEHVTPATTATEATLVCLGGCEYVDATHKLCLKRMNVKLHAYSLFLGFSNSLQ